ncbi:helix-turn-helix domain-containing protein [Clostridium sp. DJ247]|uniref:helix-turn-helix domain-containing protein n=1 Tax=Clostridium sp. DJ247 TaxID=2726188 RepID=UPI001627A23A|nr:helix-turn-helix transcriptional regulator [Clostridium sp. DJ247]MBC2579697.1 helix-turn-helix transcriptional regulator [Clostridium sp. DJ247]
MFNKEKIVELLNEKGWTAYRLCKEANIAQSTLSDILNGKKKNPSANTLTKLAIAFGVSVDEFFKEKDIENKSTYKKEKIINKINKIVKENGIKTIAAHFEGEEFTEGEKSDIEKFIKFVISQRENK